MISAMNCSNTVQNKAAGVLALFLCLRLFPTACGGEVARADFLLETTNKSHGNSETAGKVQDFLFLPPATMPATYRHMADLFATRIIKRGQAVYPLPRAETPLAVSYQAKGKTVTTDEFMSRNNVTGLLLIKDGKIVLERYGSGNTEETKWPSWSIAKSVTSTLVGAALKDGCIGSIDDPVTRQSSMKTDGAFTRRLWVAKTWASSTSARDGMVLKNCSSIQLHTRLV